eukprot:CAMPEP_0204506202 /NCGR_PEP_ID=MMETSP0471-20130131/109128_1 /ASSEMBLY_ACC=CAM_ASM_000602 /TAXON_ID=2969 /ORGANISM="Oxyrrhis marina" /LENGTH=243 /DNA_ID=CAMNT_0051511193 /DNA_START=72 /DNA_END=803 /DNA_ORIENTATION=+
MTSTWESLKTMEVAGCCCGKMGLRQGTVAVSAMVVGMGVLAYLSGELLLSAIYCLLGGFGLYAALARDAQSLKIFMGAVVTLVVIKVVVLLYYVVVQHALVAKMAEVRCAGLRHEQECLQWMQQTFGGKLALIFFGISALIVLCNGFMVLSLVAKMAEVRCAGLRHEQECLQWMQQTFGGKLALIFFGISALIVLCNGFMVLLAYNLKQVVEAGGNGDEMMTPAQYKKEHGHAGEPIVVKEGA